MLLLGTQLHQRMLMTQDNLSVPSLGSDCSLVTVVQRFYHGIRVNILDGKEVGRIDLESNGSFNVVDLSKVFEFHN